MKKIISISLLTFLLGCTHTDQLEENLSRTEIIDYIPASETQEPILETENAEDEVKISVAEEKTLYPPHSVGALLDAEIPGKDFTIGRVLADNAVYTRHYITYISDGLKISGIMNVPKATTDDPGPWPVLFLNHGYIDPAVYTNGRGLKREQDYFARNGYVVIHSDYRDHAQSDKNPVGRDKVGESGYTRDILGGINAIESLNPDFAHVNQVGLLGHSMGGGVTMKAAVARPEQIGAMALYAPVSSDYKDNLLRWGMNRILPSELEKIQDAGGQWDGELIAPYSAMTYFDRIEAPVMIHHGDRDADVPIQWSKDTLNRLTKAGKDVTYHEYPGEAHEYGPQWQTFMQRNLDFFDQLLK